MNIGSEKPHEKEMKSSFRAKFFPSDFILAVSALLALNKNFHCRRWRALDDKSLRCVWKHDLRLFEHKNAFQE